MRWILVGTIMAAAVAPCHANDFSYNDCIINGMKGVSSDAAAYLVRKACSDKQEERRQQMVNALKEEYGDSIDTASIAKGQYVYSESDGFVSIDITNSKGTLRIPRNLDSDSTANWTAIPRESGHPFHANLDSRSVATRG